MAAHIFGVLNPLEQTLLKHAQAHFASEPGGSASETEGMRTLRALGARLGVDARAPAQLLAALQDAEGAAAISTFEFLSSGAVAQLKAYLQGARVSCVVAPAQARKAH